MKQFIFSTVKVADLTTVDIFVSLAIVTLMVVLIRKAEKKPAADL
jgi:hypothetical protein